MRHISVNIIIICMGFNGYLWSKMHIDIQNTIPRHVYVAVGRSHQLPTIENLSLVALKQPRVKKFTHYVVTDEQVPGSGPWYVLLSDKLSPSTTDVRMYKCTTPHVPIAVRVTYDRNKRVQLVPDGTRGCAVIRVDHNNGEAL